ncbi:DUF1708 domain-containing protein [Haloarcula nitratireducens]|uniref:DUF1708 domain-containing protein n=1 Tax=Haloarcula nitratireducens TaxID=2487749 RepID=A0AAW4PF20_9EURY|nr:DUF1708 domain-containing protein [Halomicroarcula nitratireducens]MBX0296248.1 DUF1708 domain-containing protein [Halomicroarcula nitratireducens]
MSTIDTDRERLRRVREKLDHWQFDARDAAYEEFFGGENAAVTDEERRLLDEIDSTLVRQTGRGLWDADEYGVVAAGVAGENPQVVCIGHPEIPDEGYRDEDSLSESTRAELNDLLWEYAERVASRLQTDLDDFLRDARDEG